MNGDAAMGTSCCFFMEKVTRGFWLVGGVDPGRPLGFQPRPESALLVGNGEKVFFLWESDSSFVVCTHHFIEWRWAGDNIERSEE